MKLLGIQRYVSNSKKAGSFPPKPFLSLRFLPWEGASQAAAHKVSPWKLCPLISTPSGIARRSRNQGVIGGVK